MRQLFWIMVLISNLAFAAVAITLIIEGPKP